MPPQYHGQIARPACVKHGVANGIDHRVEIVGGARARRIFVVRTHEPRAVVTAFVDDARHGPPFDEAGEATVEEEAENKVKGIGASVASRQKAC